MSDVVKFIRRTAAVWDDKISPICKIWIYFNLIRPISWNAADWLMVAYKTGCEWRQHCHAQQILRDIHSTSSPFILYSYNCRVQFNFLLSFFSSSAGVGRTGVLIFMETAFNMIEGAEPIFPLEIVRKMRDQRCSLIQTPVSWQFKSIMTFAVKISNFSIFFQLLPSGSNLIDSEVFLFYFFS